MGAPLMLESADTQPARAYWSLPIPVEQALSAGTAPQVEAIKVYVNHGRWVAECPDCRGAQLACTTDHRFLCTICGNVEIGGLWRPAVWPEDADAIDAELSERAKRNRNWTPGETLADLVAERLERDLPTEPQGPMRASAWEGHTHTWPATRNEPLSSCEECGLTLPTEHVDESESARVGERG